MPTFVHPALLWGLPLIAVPVLIHLINMFRHRRTAWAAMEFLVVSQKKNRTWVFFKQLLLLLMRMAAIALIVLMLAQPRVDSRMGGLLGGGTTHHIVLLDDSYSMSDRWGDTSAIDEAKSVIRRIAGDATRRSRSQMFTLLRFSKAGRSQWGTQPDLLEDRVDADLPGRLEETLSSLGASELAMGPAASLEAIVQLLGESQQDERIVYLISDFRSRHWDEPGDLRSQLTQVNRLGARIELIQCVDTRRPNLAITRIVPGEGTRAAGVPLLMDVTVANLGETPASNVAVLLSADGRAVPAIQIEEIPAGREVTERFPVHFPTPSEHVITAELGTDCVLADNRRQCVVDFPSDLPVLLIDGDTEAEDGKYLSAALSPGGPVATGIRPRMEGPRFLSLNSLEPYQAVYLLNVERLDSVAVEALREYVESGGGVAFFLGPRTDVVYFNENLFADGQGLFPLPLTGQETLFVDRLQKAPDLEVQPHPIFRILAGERNSFISTVGVERYFGVTEPWPESVDVSTQVIARLRNGAPFCVERTLGEGRVVAFFSTAAPTWNNWARGNPSFVVAMLELQAFLARKPSDEATRLVGTPLELKLKANEYSTAVRFVPPVEEAEIATTTDATVLPGGDLLATFGETDAGGVYTARLTAVDGSTRTRRFAFNVDPEEGDLRLLKAEDLATRLDGVKYRYAEAEEFQYTADELGGRDLALPLLCVLILLLVVEQIFAYASSYHPPRSGRFARLGGAGQ